MKAVIEDLQDTFKIGYEQYEDSRVEAKTVWDMYHNRQYTQAQLLRLKERGQPAETFNVVKLFARMLLGYYSSVVNTVMALPVAPRDVATASVLNDAIAHVFRDNNFTSEADKIKLSGLISGLLISYVEVVPTNQKDRFGRVINRVKISHVPDYEIVLDPSSELEDYSDANFLHRFKWISEDKVNATFGEGTTNKLDAYDNHVSYEDTSFEKRYNGQFYGKYKVFDNYLIIHSVVKEPNGKRYSVFWSGDEILRKKEVSFKDVDFPYRVERLHVSDTVEYYGIFREVIESQKAINQALLKLQLMANSQKAYVEETALKDNDIEAFADAFNRVNGVVVVKSLSGLKIAELSREVLDQYTIIDKAFDRIQRVLSVNDSFLGMAFASDSGRKVKLQQNASVVALRYLTNRVEQFYRLLGWDIAKLIKQYYKANQLLRITDDASGQRWTEINRPAEVPTGNVGPDGQPELGYAYEEALDPATNEPMKDQDGNFMVVPIPDAETDIAFSNIDIEITSVAYNDEDEKNQLMVETMLSGNIGNLLAQVNPAGYFKASALAMKTMKTKYSPEISNILAQTAQILEGNQEGQAQASEAAAGQGSSNRQPLSQSQKLPQNTNE